MTDTKVIKAFIEDAISAIEAELLGCRWSGMRGQPTGADWEYSFRVSQNRIVKIVVNFKSLSYVEIQGYGLGRRVALHEPHARARIVASFRRIIKNATSEEFEIVFRSTGMRARTKKYKK